MKVDKNTFTGSAALFGAALIWGLAFSAQKAGMKYCTPELFTSMRSFIGAAVLLPLIVGISRCSGKPVIPATASERKTLLTGGVCCGAILAAASTTQQYGLIYSSAGKAGFITSLYIVFVPLAGVFSRSSRVGWLHWFAVTLALSGSYLLCSPADGALNAGDIWLLACAILFAGHILVIGCFAPKTDCVKMSCIQFFTAGVLTAAVAVFRGYLPDFQMLKSVLFPLLYCGICSSGIAFTLQVVSQRYITGATASVIMSMESVISVVGGYLFLSEKLSCRELVGCAIILAAVVAAQLPAATGRKITRPRYGQEPSAEL